MKFNSGLIILLCSYSIMALTFEGPRPYVVSSPMGYFYLKMVPLDNTGENGKLTVYKVNYERGDSILYEINGWYASEAYISINAEIIVRINYPRRQSLSEAASEIMIGFYKLGKKIRTYEAGDLIKKPNLTEHTFHGYKWYSFLNKVIGFTDQSCKEFEILTSDNESIIFNIMNGDIIKRTQKD